jgi:hypothetical protein
MIVRLPLEHRQVGSAPCPRPRLTLLVRSHYGDYARVPFVVDTGADFTSIPVAHAEREGITFQRSVETAATGLVGRTTTFRDHLHVFIAEREYDWPCNFVVAPPGARDTLPVLGRAGFLAAFEIAIRDESLILVRRGSAVYWCRRVCSFLAAPFVRRAAIDQPL